MALINLLLSPDSAICRYYGIEPQSDAGLMRWMINTFFMVKWPKYDLIDRSMDLIFMTIIHFIFPFFVFYRFFR